MPGLNGPKTPLDMRVLIATAVSWLALAGVIRLVWPEFGVPWTDAEMLVATAGFLPLLLLWSWILRDDAGKGLRR
jgi:hypothetical protein